MRDTILWCCASILATVVFIGSCTNSYGEFDLSESPIGFLKGLNQVTVSFPTDDPNQVLKLKFKKKVGAIRPSLATALNFLKMNTGHEKRYLRDQYDCKQFAYNLFLDAQKENYQAQFIILELKNEQEGHALMALQTIDAGLLYVDFTPFLMKEGEQKPSQSVAFVKEGQPYIRIPLSALDRNFKNSEIDFLAFKQKMEKGDREIENYNESYLTLEKQKREVEARVANFKQRSSSGRIVSSEYEKLKREHEELEDEIDDINSRYNHLGYEETRIKNLYLESDWVGKSWIVDKVKAVP